MKPPPLMRGEPMEVRFVRRALGAFVRGDAPLERAPDGLDWREVDRCVSAHSLGPVLARALAPGLAPPPLADAWRSTEMNYLFTNARYLKEMTRFLARLESADVPATTLRGLALAQRLYGDLGLRPMSDLDVLIRPDDRERLREALAADGLEPYEIYRSQYIYNVGDVEFEVHWSFLTAKRYRARFRSDELIDAGQRVDLRDAVLPALADEHEMIGLVTHALAHHELARLNSLVDVGRLALRPGLDWAALADYCARERLTLMVGLTLRFVQRLFGLDLPAPVDDFAPPVSRAVEREFEALATLLFGGTTLAHHLRRRRFMVRVAESPEGRARQLMRFVRRDEVREIFRQMRRRVPAETKALRAADEEPKPPTT